MPLIHEDASTATGQLPASQTAIVQHEGGQSRVTAGVPLPTLAPDQVLVRTRAVALNPCDFKMADRFPSPGARVGCDFAGEVVSLGAAAASPSFAGPRFTVGQRVCGAVHGSNPIDHQAGAFAEYVAIDAEFLFAMPSAWSFETAAAFGGTGVGTLGLALFESLQLPGSLRERREAAERIPVLVYGGSTSVGTMAIQLLRLLGHRPITTCSPRNFNLVRSYGADEVFDYSDPECAQKIRACTKNGLRHVLDIITDVRSMKLCYAAIGRAGGRYTCLEAYPEDLHTRKTVKPELVMGISILGRRIALDHGYGSEASPERRRLGVQWYRDLQAVLDRDGLIRTHPVKVLPGGFEGMLSGLQRLKSKQVSGEKLVVRVE